MFPRVKLIKMRYCDINLGLTPSNTATPSVVKTWSANNLHDPAIVGGPNPHQPAYHDTWASLYNDYTVVGAKLTIKVTWQNNALDKPILIGIRTRGPNASVINANTYFRLCEQQPGFFKGWKRLYPNITAVGTGIPASYQARGQRAITISKGYSRRKTLHIPKKDGLLSQSEMKFTTTIAQMTDPENPPWYFDLMTCAPFGASSGRLDAEIKIEYTVALQDPILVALQ